MRLMEKKDSGHWCLRDVPWDQMKPGAVLTQKTWEKLYGALWKLKDYEDTGKSQEEIECMDNDMQVTAKGMLKRVAELSAEVDRMKAEGFWIPVTERFPEPGDYVLLSFSNFILPQVGRYEEAEKGGAFFAGDETKSLVSKDIYVNAWMPLPGAYRAEVEEKPVAGTGWKDHYMGRLEKSRIRSEGVDNG